MKHNDKTEGPAQPLLFTRAEAAARLKIGLSTLDLLIKQGRIAVVRIGRRRLFTPKALEKYITEAESFE